MKIKIFCLLSCIAILLTTCSLPCFATVRETEEPLDVDSVADDLYFDETTMVYASSEKQEQLYKLLQEGDCAQFLSRHCPDLIILKESITPVYTIDLLEYAETEKLNMRPMWWSKSNDEIGIDIGKGNAYIAKAVTSENQFAGNIRFFIKDGVAYIRQVTLSEHTWGNYAEDGETLPYAASCSYADHASRIAEILKEDGPIFARDIKYVEAYHNQGDFFYVKNDKHDILISVGTIYPATAEKDQVHTDYTLDPHTPLLEIAKRCLRAQEVFLAEKAAWEAEHPGEVWNQIGSGGVEAIVSECSRVDNILDIAAFLREDEARWIKAENFRKYGIPSIIATASALVIAGGVVTYVVIKRRRRRLETEEPNAMP